LAVGDGERVRFWNPRTGKPAIDPWQIGSGFVNLLSFIDATTVAVVADPNSALSIRTYPSGKELASLKIPAGRSLNYMATAGRMVVGGGAGFIALWSDPKWREQWLLELTNAESPSALSLSPDRSELAVGARDAGVRVYSTKDGKVLRGAGRDKLVLPSLRGVVFSPSGRELVVAPVARDPNSRRTDDIWGLAIFEANLSEHRAVIRWGRPSESPLGCVFSPDGKTLLIPTRGHTVRIYEVETGRLRSVGSVAFDPNRFAVSPGGRLLAIAGSGPNVSVVDWRAAKAGKSSLDAKTFDSLWADLASADSTKGFRAVVALGAAPARAAELIGNELKPVPVPNASAVKRWVAELGSEDFATREAAEKELAELGDVIEPELRAAAKSDDNDRRAAAIRLLAAATRRNNPKRLRILRAVEVLEYADTPTGRDALKALAAGAPTSLLTRDAKAALVRLEAFDPKP
jgi:hypothetical protein